MCLWLSISVFSLGVGTPRCYRFRIPLETGPGCMCFPARIGAQTGPTGDGVTSMERAAMVWWTVSCLRPWLEWRCSSRCCQGGPRFTTQFCHANKARLTLRDWPSPLLWHDVCGWCRCWRQKALHSAWGWVAMQWPWRCWGADGFWGIEKDCMDWQRVRLARRPLGFAVMSEVLGCREGFRFWETALRQGQRQGEGQGQGQGHAPATACGPFGGMYGSPCWFGSRK